MTKALTPVDKTDDTNVPADLDAYLRADAVVEAINANLPAGADQIAPIPKEYVFRRANREAVSAAFHAAFELRGGVPSFAHWAKHNPKDFYALYSKLLPSETETPVGNTTYVFNSAIPQNPLDLVNVGKDGHVIAETDEDFDE